MISNVSLLPTILRSAPLRLSLAGLAAGNPEARLPRTAPHTLPVLWAAAFLESRRSILMLVPRPEDAVEVVSALELYTHLPAHVLHWPAYDFLPYERGAAQIEMAAARLRLLERLHGARNGGDPVMVVASFKALSEPTMSVRDFSNHRLNVRVDSRLDLLDTARSLTAAGYRAAPLVEVPGSFSRRGGILDIWSPSGAGPVRIELFGDEVESIRSFDPVTQRSEAVLQEATIVPPTELPLHESAAALTGVRELELENLRPEVRSEWEQAMLDLEIGGLRPVYGGFAPYFPGGMATLIEHLPAGSILATDHAERLRLVADSLHAQAQGIRDELEKTGEIPRGLRRPYFTWEELQGGLDRLQKLCPADWDDAEAGTVPLLGAVTGFGGNVERMLERVGGWAREGRKVVLLTRQADRLRRLLTEHGIPLVTARGGIVEPRAGAATVVPGTLREGWISEELDLVVLGDGELWGYTTAIDREARRSAAPRRNRTPTFLADLQPGGFVVHIDHGIARYIGNISRGAPGAEREYLLLEYGSGDKLYVPVDQVDRVSPYIGAGGDPSLSRLGTADWARTKRRVKRAADDLAQELLRIYAARQMSKGFSYSPDGPLQHEFDSAFPYVETEDQMHAIEEVKTDMESPRPMDRLVCGDVGYGKTEVALRAAFKAVVDGKQVAVLVPTTVLALQHYETFKRRCAPFPVRVEMLSRLRSKKERDQTIDGLRTGAVDIVIGTHRLLQKDVGFRDLGLLIVDEEQRFGVKHKELLKRLRSEIDVLTMTATPIPRTLQMALAGVRDMSIIDTPPGDRLPIKTYVTPKSDTLIRESVLREMDRGGQVFYVHNKVHDIARVARELQETVPEARVAVGHGRMEDNQLENVMLSFVQQEHDVLLCTTIIESGLDIPNANTLLVDDATNFGLAQLYQLRGRVGRGTNRAYAYLMFRDNARVSEEAQKRLDAISQATELGAGFRIAMKDLELRGAGNFLGPEQSGQVAAVGLDMYTRLLERAVQEAKTGQPAPEPPAVTLDLPLDASLPAAYVTDRDTRLRLYRRLAATATERDLRLMEEELRDRFGPLPEPAANLIRLIELKLLASEARIPTISLLEGDIVLRTTVLPRRRPRPKGARIRFLPGQIRLTPTGSQDRWLAELRSLLIDLAEEIEEEMGAEDSDQLAAARA